MLWEFQVHSREAQPYTSRSWFPQNHPCGLLGNGHPDWCEVLPRCSYHLQFSYNKWCRFRWLKKRKPKTVWVKSDFLRLASWRCPMFWIVFQSPVGRTLLGVRCSLPSGMLCEYEVTSVIVVQLLSRVWLFATPWTAAHQASLSITISQSLLRLSSIESVMPSNHLILCHPLLLLTSIFPSIWVFSSESALLIWWPKYWSFSFSTSPSNEYSGLISFRIDWFYLLAVQGTLKSLLQHYIHRHQFFGAQPSLGSSSHIRIGLLEKP